MTQDTIHITPDTIRQARRVVLAYTDSDERYLQFMLRLSAATGLSPNQCQELTRQIAALRMPT